MVTKIIENTTRDFTSGNNIEVPAGNPNWRSPSITQPTLYDYLTVLPAIIAAATPLILGLTAKSDFLIKRQFREKQKQEKQQTNDVSD
ncbi:MAG: hypothetical protein ACYTXA_25430 [Nostoc sp.]